MIPDNESATTQYERQAQSIRHSLSNSINELNQRLTPGQVFDEVLSYAKGGGGTFLRAFSNAARENPVPSLLIGTGCMLFLSQKMGLGHTNGGGYRGNGHRERAADANSAEHPSGIRRAASAVGTKAAEIAGTVKHGVESLGDTIGSATQQVREKAHDARDQVSGTLDQMKESAQGVGDSVAETAAHTRQQAIETGRQIKNRASGLIHEQPLLVAGIGLALGAALAAILPTTRLEDRLMGETSDNLKKSLGDAASEQLQAAKETAGRVADEAMAAAGELAEREGLTPRAAARKVRNLGDKAAGTAGGPFDT
jgi:ElaB/YqjD/DUF883 family membrane-anchored ribosome-binding protein